MDVLIVGLGPIGIEYAKISKALGKSILAIGRSQKGCDVFSHATGIAAVVGGLDQALNEHTQLPAEAIVSVSEAQLGIVARQLLGAGVSKILIEKPGGASADDIRSVAKSAEQSSSKVYVGYNRRFYASTLEVEKMIVDDDGLTSFQFEFTEWSHVIESIEKEPGVKEDWFLQNSSHVIDMAFHIGGWPTDISSFASGRLNWHPRARYAGAGESQKGALFSYFADWEAPGRWSLEFMTRKRRFIFRPMEALQVQLLGSVAIEAVDIDDRLDKKYKPGFYRQTEAFFNRPDQLLTIEDQVGHLETYAKMNPAG